MSIKRDAQRVTLNILKAISTALQYPTTGDVADIEDFRPIDLVVLEKTVQATIEELRCVPQNALAGKYGADFGKIKPRTLI